MIYSLITSYISKIFRYKSYSFLNVIGLSIGMASFITITSYVYDEYSYDKYHTNYDRIYRIVSLMDFDGLGEESVSQPFPLAPALAVEYNKYIESYVRFFNLQRSQFLVSYKSKVYNERRFFYCDSSVFNIFDFELVKGNKTEVLKEPFSILLTKSTAKKYFENANPIGKKLIVDGKYEFTVKGILSDVKHQSHFKFDFLASFSSLPFLFARQNGGALDDWIWNPCWTYILLKKDINVKQFQAKLNKFTKKKYAYDTDNVKFRLQALSDIHLRSNFDYEIEKNGNLFYVEILIALAFLILFIAIINFVSLITAGAIDRAKYIGIRKAVGASKIDLIRQFLIESVSVSFISLFIAMSLVELVVPFFNYITDGLVIINFKFNLITSVSLFFLSIVTGLVSGIYPAIFLSNHKTTQLLQHNLILSTKFLHSRKIMVFVQLFISLWLILTTLGIHNQLQYLRTADLGFKKKNTIIINAGTEEASRYDEFKYKLLKYNNIKGITAMNYIIGSSHNTYSLVPENSSNIDYQFYPGLFVRDDFVETLEIKIVAGRDFNKLEQDSGTAILVNEEMCRYLNFENPADILDTEFVNRNKTVKVVGVFSNINTTSLHSKIEPFAILMHGKDYEKKADTKYIVIKTSGNSIDSAISTIEKVWTDMKIHKPFEYKILTDILQQHYQSEEVLVEMVGTFTLLSIIISLFGIWGLSSYITECRTREIGIRKSLGASIFSIIKLIVKEFALIMFFANILSWLFAYILLNNWANNFAYKDYIHIWLFLLSSLFASTVALATVIYKALIVGMENPINAIKHE